MMNMMPGMPGSMPQQGGGGAGMSLPQLLAMIQGSQGGGGGGMSVPPPGAATPMANYIGAPGGGGMMQHPAMPPVAAPTQLGPPGGGAAQPAGAPPIGGSAGLMQLLAQLRGGQTGVQPGQGGVPGPNAPGNTQSALTMGPNGMWGGTPGQPPPMAPPMGQPGMQPGMQQPGMPPGGGVPQAMASGMSGQMSPQQMQWLHSIFGGAQVPPQPTPMMGGNG